MPNHNDTDDRRPDITEATTGDFPQLDAAVVESSEREASGKAVSCLAHLEAELDRLHTQWESIDAEFKGREAKIAELRAEIELRENTLATLAADLQREQAAIKAAGDQLERKDAEIAALVEDRRLKDERIAALASELAGAAADHDATLEKLKLAEADAARLDYMVRQEQAAAAGIAERNERLVAEHNQLRGKLQDLETYINGRHASWSEQSAELVRYKDALSGLETILAKRESATERHSEEQAQLATKVLDLERHCAEIEERRKEREQEFDALQKRLDAQLLELEQLKAEHAARAKESEQAAQGARDAQRNIESLEQELKRRDESIVALSSELERSNVSLDELTTANNVLAVRVHDLEKSVAERSQEMLALREDLRMSHDQLRIVQQQLSDRTAQLAASQQALEQKGRHLERVNNDLRAVHESSAHVRGELEKLEARAKELDALRGAATAEAERLEAELAAQRELLATLEAEVRAKQAAVDLLERSVERISSLGASVAALDKLMKGSHEEKPAGDSASPAADFAATVAADNEAAAAQRADATVLLPIDVLLDDSDEEEVIDVGEGADVGAPCRLVATIDGEAFDYPIAKKSVTIGRGHASDIRIGSHFVSRLHAKISTSGIATIIEDAGSKNGTLVNSERVHRRVLRHGDVVSLGGEFDLRFVDATH
jgi:chromosome segregation ATPase